MKPFSFSEMAHIQKQNISQLYMIPIVNDRVWIISVDILNMLYVMFIKINSNVYLHT